MIWSEQIEIENLRIICVGALDGDSFSITMESGHSILLELGHRAQEPPFAALIESGLFSKPYTDGKGISWPGGTSITLYEILRMLLSSGDRVQNKNNDRSK